MTADLNPGDELPAEEDILRAITTDIIQNGVISSQVFKGGETSVSRLAMYSVEEHWRIFRRPGGVEKPPNRVLVEIGQINIATLQAVGRAAGTDLTVAYDPLDWNDAHAIIPQKISRGLANQLRDKLARHHEPRAQA